MDETTTAVIGAGPAGLAVCVALAARGLGARLLDATGEVGGAYARVYPGMRLSSPWAMNHLPDDARVAPREGALTASAYAGYLRDYAAAHGLRAERASVRAVRREKPSRYLVDTDVGALAARHVVVASGMFSHPRRPELAGAPSIPVIHAAEYRGEEGLVGARVLVVGSGTSAWEIAWELTAVASGIDLAARTERRPAPRALLGLDVHWWLRPLEIASRYTYKAVCGGTRPADDPRLLGWVESGRARVFPRPKSIDGDRVSFADGRSERYDAVILATGYEHHAPYLPPEVRTDKAGVGQCRSRAWPGLFVLGFPCVRSVASEYLRGIAEDAPVVAAHIARDAS